MMRELEPYMKANAAIPQSSFCTIPESIIRLPTPEALETIIDDAVNTWLQNGTIIRASIDNGWNSPLTLAG
ncbi:hypothetical protein O0I10_006140 [Lichtheimia ornata]|uniref:Uncharacterized protein n=1 Tax=Lichtheimia ornata TaxID=688661 RepID=A0AAD7XZ11_9FUNG|nr:uncharacterized protein O0I10_006140 [Lichtheimia ornata]KAJ8658133.1 hypothetical protein O0I10_006140 [Lichtheimia ornata]